MFKCIHLCEFILNYRADLDPIYYCELLKTCTVKDDGDAKINSVVVSPEPVVYGEEDKHDYGS